MTLATVCFAVIFALAGGCKNVASGGDNADLGPLLGDKPTPVLTGDTLFVTVWAVDPNEPDPESEIASTVTDVVVHFAVANPAIARIIGPADITTVASVFTGDKAVAVVEIETIADGTTAVTATAPGHTMSNGTALGYTFEVKARRPLRISFGPDPVAVPIGATGGATITSWIETTAGDNVYGTPMKWSCPQGEGIAQFIATSNTACATGFGEGGTIIPVQRGTTVIHAQLPDALYARFPVGSNLSVTVTSNPARVDLIAGGPVTIASGMPMIPTLYDVAGNALPDNLFSGGKTLFEQLTWSSSDPGVATVDSHGIVTGVAPDVVTITANYQDDIRALPSFSGSITLTVGASTNHVVVAPGALSVITGGIKGVTATVTNASGQTLTNFPVTWLSRNTSIADYLGGNIRGLSTGTPTTTPSATVQVLARAAGAQGLVDVTVYRQVATVSLLPGTLTLHPSESSTLGPVILRDNLNNVVPLAATTLTWTSTDPAIATVDQTGHVIAVSAGTGTQSTVTIRATTAEGASGIMELTVAAIPLNNVSYNFCAATGVPLWVAIQDGAATAPWTQVAASGNNYGFNISSGKGGIAYVTQISGATALHVFYGSQADLQTQGTASCGNTGTLKTINGLISNIGTAATTFVGLGSTLTSLPTPTTTFQLPSVSPGSLDLVGATMDGAPSPNAVRMLLHRSVNLADNGSTGTLNFLAEGFPPAVATLTPTVFDQGIGVTYQFYGGTQQLTTYFAAFSSAGPGFKLFGIPAAQLAPGDLHFISARAYNGTGTTTSYRDASVAVTGIANMGITIGPVLFPPVVTIPAPATTPYGRVRAVVTVQPEYPLLFQLELQQSFGSNRNVTIQMTTHYAGAAAAVTLEAPDFAGAPGWNNSWGLLSGFLTHWIATSSAWTPTTGIVFTPFPLVNGATFNSATRQGDVTP